MLYRNPVAERVLSKILALAERDAKDVSLEDRPNFEKTRRSPRLIRIPQDIVFI